ncbi:MAG: sulfotransferase [Flavobacteriales bacterium]|nr:sulfotransferase [Flavobacteriales bacterium]
MNPERHTTDFFVIGVVKGGTTSLYDYLNQHPELYLPPIKEINHFARTDIDESKFLPEYATDVSIDLERYFKNGMPEMVHIAHINDPNDYKKLYSPAQAGQKTGDISNSYMICPSAASAIHAHNPSAKIIVILRNPINRAWSQYLMNLRESKTETKDFIEELENDSRAVNQGWGVNHQYLELGNYSKQLKLYYDLFSAEQILPIIFEEYVKQPTIALRKICQFIGVSPEFEFDTSGKKNAASLPRNKTLNSLLVKSGAIKLAKDLVPRKLRQNLSGVLYSSKNLPSLATEEISYLRGYYLSEINGLCSLINRDLTSIWQEFKS